LAPRLCALAVLALLPRDIYTAVFVSNDAALGFAVSLAVLLYLEATQRGGDGRWALRPAALFAAACGAAWTKQSGLITAILPVAFAIWWECECSRRAPSVPPGNSW
jgi:4-amino-4-deoxy-L-arabinose transferase-like glycosyltransferase